MIGPKHFRAVASTAALWAVAWPAAALPYTAWLVARLHVGAADSAALAGRYTLAWARTGLLTGLVFAVALALFGRRRTLGTLRPAWVALWGAAAGLAHPLSMLGDPAALSTGAGPALLALIFGVNAALGAGAALLTLWAARRPGTGAAHPPPNVALQATPYAGLAAAHPPSPSQGTARSLVQRRA